MNNDPFTDLRETHEAPENAQTAYFAGGCFWCVEEIFHQTPGVYSVVSGYMGGEMPSPSYQAVSSGATGHAEAVRIIFDPEKTSYDELLELFWKAHDPTQKNRQGPDVGTQYRSAIFYVSAEQKNAAEQSRAALDESGRFDRPIATEIVKAGEFYPAEEYHQNFYRKHPDHPYTSAWLEPKLEKLGMKTY